MSKNHSFFPLNNNIIYRKSKINKKNLEKIDENINKNIGPYIIINKLKEGNNSKVYLGKSKYTNDEVAIKIISKESLQENLEDLTLILNQIESLKILKHKNIISLYEVYESPKYFYLIMEYFPKKNLIEKIILKKRLNENETLIIFIQLLDALVYMHKMNITHRNIRTEHILFDKNNRPKIIGFNYSTFYEKNKKIEGMFGSLCYSCPEILNNEEYNPELADIWSLGVVLYVMICGYLPFSEENDEKNKNLICEGKIDYPKEISNKIKDLLKHMLEVNCNKRYNFQKILKHPWVKKFTENKNIFIGGINIIEMKYPVDEKILNIIEIYFKNFDKNEIRKNLIENKYNEGTGLYKMLLRNVIDMKFNSVSDLFSENFIKYIQNKNNYYNKVDKNDKNNLYLKYIDNVNNKINKLENYIDNYKKKEDEVVKYLLNIDNLVKTIRKSNNIIKNNNKFSNELKTSIKNKIHKNNELKNSIKKKIINNSVLKRSIKNNIYQNNELKNSIVNKNNNTEPKKDYNQNKNNINKENQKDDDLDIDVIQKFKEQQQKKKKIENILINSEIPNEKLSQSLLNKNLNKANTPDTNMNNSNLIETKDNNKIKADKSNKNLDTMKSITPDSQKFLNHILINKEKEKGKDMKDMDIDVDKDKDNKINDSLLYSIKRRHTHYKQSFRKSHIDRGSLLDGYLKKNHPDNIRKTLLRFSLFSNISEEDDDKKLEEIIREEKNDNTNDSEEENKNKLNELKLSLSFMDDGDEPESEFNESSYVSRNDVRFISEIKDALKELKDLKKKEKEDLQQNNKNKNDELQTSTKKSNFKDNATKEKEKNVQFSKFIKNNINNLIKENVSHFFINNIEKIEEKNNNNDDNYIIFEGADFSFHDDDNKTNNIQKNNLYKIKNIDICFYKNDKLTISKLNCIINNQDMFSINNIENKRQKIYLFSFTYDKSKINKINVNNNIINQNYINTKLLIFIDKTRNYNYKNNNNILLDKLNKERNINNKKNKIVKYNESILNKSNNNVQSELNVNSSNNSNSLSSNNKNSSINMNNNYFLYDNNFVINDNNEDDDTISKIRDSNKDTSLDISSIQRINKNISNKKDNEDSNKNKNNFQNLSDNLRSKKDNNDPKIYDNELINNNNNKKTRKKNVSIQKKNNRITLSSSSIRKTKKKIMSLTGKNNKDKHKSFIYNKMRNKSLDFKNYLSISNKNRKISKDKIKKKEKTKDKILPEKQVKNTDKKQFKKLQNEFIYNSNRDINLNNYKTTNNFSEVKKHPVNIYKKKHARYSSQIDNRNIFIKHDFKKNDTIKSQVNTISLDDIKNNKKKSKKLMDRNTNKKYKKENKILNEKKQNNNNNNNNNNLKKKNEKDTNKKDPKINKKNKSLNLINQITNQNDKNKIKINNKEQKIKDNLKTKSLIIKNRDNEDKNIIHLKTKINNNQNKNIENMLSKRKEMINKIRNCKNIMNKYTGQKCYSKNQTNESLLSNLKTDTNSNTGNIKFSGIKSEVCNNKDDIPAHKKILSENNIIYDSNKYNTNNNLITNNINVNSSIKNKNEQNDLVNKYKNNNSSPYNLNLEENRIPMNLNYNLNLDYNPNNKNLKNKLHNSVINNNIYEVNAKKNNNNNINNTSGNSFSLSQENYSDKNNYKKKLLTNDINNNKSISSIKECSDFNDYFVNFEDISLIEGKCKK